MAYETKHLFLKTFILPGVVPRVQEIMRSGFHLTAALMAHIFVLIGLLPKNHAYVKAENYGRFGSVRVLRQGYAHLKWEWRYADKIAIYFAMLMGLAALFIQLALFLFSIFVLGSAVAAPPDSATIFGWFGNTPAGANTDIAFRLLDMVFGLPDMYNSCVTTNSCTTLQGNPQPMMYGGTYPWPVHTAFRSLLGFYNAVIVGIGILIIFYMFISTVLETAREGVPFGQRFNRVWAPIRIILFFALIMPFAYDGTVNTAQWITFKVAKWGSNVATNGWREYNAALTETYLGDAEHLIAQPNAPRGVALATFNLVMQTCRHAESRLNERKIEPYIVLPPGVGAVTGNCMPLEAGTSFDEVVNFSGRNNITIRFGERSEPCTIASPTDETYKDQSGYVYPYCGEMSLDITGIGEPGARDLKEDYFNFIKTLWQDPQTRAAAANLVDLNTSQDPDWTVPDTSVMNYAVPTIDSYQASFRTSMENSIDAQRAAAGTMPPELLNCGWACAAVWYNRVAEMNGAMSDAVYGLPAVTLWPSVMEAVRKERQELDADFSGSEQFNPRPLTGDAISLDSEENVEIASILNRAYQFWVMHPALSVDEFGNVTNDGRSNRSSFFKDFINMLLGSGGLFDMYKNADTHPLAQLSALGKSLMDAALRNLAIGTVGGGSASVMSLFELEEKYNIPTESLALIAGAVQAAGMATIVMGFILYYVLPFLPFLYFFFALSGWVKAIFEAVVAVPLWALAHLRIDGEGIPGKTGASGYYLLLEIFLRPILTVFGLLGSILVLSAMVRVLNYLFEEIIHSVGGFSSEKVYGVTVDIPSDNPTPPPPIDIGFSQNDVNDFFLTSMYCIIVYMLAMSSFKMIDAIPNYIMRYMGASIEAMGEKVGDPAGELTGTIASRAAILDILNSFGGRKKSGAGDSVTNDDD